MPETKEVLSAIQVERDARQVLLPGIIPIFLDEALANASVEAEEPLEHFNFGEGAVSRPEDINPDIKFCPALTSLYAVYKGAKTELSDSTLLEDLITEEQREIFESHIEWSAAAPDHHFKNNFMTSYPAFALGYVYEMIRAGDVPKPKTAREVIELLKDPELDELLLMGMHAASGVGWNQFAGTPPWEIFKSLRGLYDYGKESPFVTGPDGKRSLKPEIIERFHEQMRDLNRSGTRPAIGCPVAIKTIHNVSDDPSSARHLTQDQLKRLLETQEVGAEPIAVQDERGVIRIEMDILARLREFFTGFATNYIEKNDVPVLVAARPWQHQSTVRFVKPDDDIPPTEIPEIREDCKGLTAKTPYGLPNYKLCDCAEVA